MIKNTSLWKAQCLSEWIRADSKLYYQQIWNFPPNPSAVPLTVWLGSASTWANGMVSFTSVELSHIQWSDQLGVKHKERIGKKVKGKFQAYLIYLKIKKCCRSALKEEKGKTVQQDLSMHSAQSSLPRSSRDVQHTEVEQTPIPVFLKGRFTYWIESWGYSSPWNSGRYQNCKDNIQEK